MQKGVYAYEYMDYWENFNETSLPENKDFHSDSNIEDITDEDYTNTKGVCKGFQIRDLEDYHDLCVQNDTLL